jgi:putative transposase
MNNRDYKQFAKGGIYHIYNRGNLKENIFRGNEDYSFFTFRLRQYLFPEEELLIPGSRIIPLPEKAFSLICYCLMPNHYHLLIRQNTDMPPSRLISKLATSYSKYFNAKYERVGHLFQGCYKQVPVVGNRQLLWLSAYIHQNPKKAKLVSDPIRYDWSSYSDYLAEHAHTLVSGSDIILDQFKTRKEYGHFVDDSFKLLAEKSDLNGITIDDA